jgi:sugar lactone lactonase YvrE
LYVTNNGGVYTWREVHGQLFSWSVSPEHQGGSIQRVDLRSGAVSTLYEACDGKRLIAPNDLVFDRRGGFWFTDSGCGAPAGAAMARSITPCPTARRSSGRVADSCSPTASACRRTSECCTWPTP